MTMIVLSGGFLMAVWLGYPLLLWLAKAFFFTKLQKPVIGHDAIKVSVIIAAHNESANLVARIENIFSSRYPLELIEVVIASDGSTDNTRETVDGLKTRFGNVKLVEVFPQGGRSNAHNQAVSQCWGEVLIFTDAETLFDVECITRLVSVFSKANVGFASGVLLYRNADSNEVTQSVGIYWKYEFFLRKLETEIGVYVFGTGACCAVRSGLYRAIPPTGDVDFTTPIDVVLQGYFCVHEPAALAWDSMPETKAQEFRARVRMTAKNLYGTITRWGLAGLLKRPIYSFVIFMHKIGRWLTPFAMISLFFGSVMALPYTFAIILVSGQVLFYGLAIAGMVGAPIPLSGAIFSFCLANAGFFVGVMKAIIGRVPRAYKPISQVGK